MKELILQEMKITGSLYAFYDSFNRTIFLGRKSHPEFYVIDYDNNVPTIIETQMCALQSLPYSLCYLPIQCLDAQLEEIAK